MARANFIQPSCTEGPREALGGQVADPKYRQIADDLRRKIDAGELGVGEQPLPSEKELETAYGASRNTIRDAIKWLTTRRIVETRPPRGTFVVRIDPFVIAMD